MEAGHHSLLSYRYFFPFLTRILMFVRSVFTFLPVSSKTSRILSSSTLSSVDVPSNGAKLYRLKPEPSADGRLNATTTKVGKADYDIKVTATGDYDSQSYVQIIIDGKPAGSLKYDGEPDLPSQGWRAHHRKG